MGLSLLLSTSVYAQQQRIWDGAGNSNWNFGGSAGNWSGQSAPSNTSTNTGHIAVFQGTPSDNQPNINTPTRSIHGLRFESSGWTLWGSGEDTVNSNIGATLSIGAQGIDASGVTDGTVTINTNVNFTNISSSILVGTGGTLQIMGTTTRSSSNTPGLTIGGPSANQRGTVILHGTSTLHRSTNIRGGTLKLVGNGSLGTGNLQLEHAQSFLDISEINATSYSIVGISGATANLAGIGTIQAANKTLVVSGNLTPGSGQGANLGVLSITGENAALTLGETTSLSISGNNRGSGYDAINISGLITYNGILNIQFDDELTGVFNLFDLGSHSGNFSAIEIAGTLGDGSLTGVGDIWSGNIGEYVLTFDHSTGDLSVIPEPATTALSVFVLLICLIHLRRRK